MASLILLALIVFGILHLTDSERGLSDAERLKNRGDKYYYSMDFRRAAGFYEQALKADPMLEEVYFVLADAYLTLENKEKAAEVAERGMRNIGGERMGELYDRVFDYIVEFSEGSRVEFIVREMLEISEGDLWRSDLDKITRFTEEVYIIKFTNRETGEGWSSCVPKSEIEDNRQWYEEYYRELYKTYEIILPDEPSIDNVQFNQQDLADLAYFRNLEELEIHINFSQFSELYDVISNNKNLTGLSVRGTPYNFLRYDDAWTELFENPPEFDLSPILELTRLKHLTLIELNITDIRPLSALENLEYLNIARNKITDLSALKDFPALEIFDFSGNPIISEHLIDRSHTAHMAAIIGYPARLPEDENDYFLTVSEIFGTSRGYFIYYNFSGEEFGENGYILRSELDRITEFDLTAIFHVEDLRFLKYMPNLESLTVRLDDLKIPENITFLHEAKSINHLSFLGFDYASMNMRIRLTNFDYWKDLPHIESISLINIDIFGGYLEPLLEVKGLKNLYLVYSCELVRERQAPFDEEMLAPLKEAGINIIIPEEEN